MNMSDDINKLLEWTIFFVKNKDILKKEIKDYKILKNYIEFDYGDRKHTYYVYPQLNSELIEHSTKDTATVVCLNKKENLKFVVDNWDKIIKNKKFSIVFVHMSSNQRWIIYPYTHNMITEKSALKSGLQTLFEQIPQG